MWHLLVTFINTKLCCALLWWSSSHKVTIHWYWLASALNLLCSMICPVSGHYGKNISIKRGIQLKISSVSVCSSWALAVHVYFGAFGAVYWCSMKARSHFWSQRSILSYRTESLRPSGLANVVRQIGKMCGFVECYNKFLVQCLTFK